MGKILERLGQGKEPEEIFLDFENAEVKEEEKEIHAAVAGCLDRGPAILDRLFHYGGCDEYIRKAITSPSAETEDAAWNAVLPAVDQLQEFYEFSLELESSFPKLLVALCKDDPKASLANQQALAKQLADVFDFVLRFDDAKMVNPAIQNDFSYYRRTLNRMKMSKKDMQIKIRDELANRMSLFFAYPTPMMKVLSETTAKFLAADASVPRDNVTNALATISNVCHDMVSKRKFDKDNTNMFCLRAMVGSIILFDHLAPNGAFIKKSPINIKGCIGVLKNYTTSPTDGLLNALRFTTITLNNPETPSSIKQLLN
eukprot:TRINITY_DN14527_c0_g1_i1.p1 TRINITY_DN14527_c0_g1~~TRINITY_DN14527_c0_g1_i1.p1  ORF type:complete len:314 (+),score=93.89 TRINITY_DN14527_c0_g1_i1:167-1108(+)